MSPDSSPSQRKRARELRSAGLSIREIAQTLGVPRATVGDWVRGLARGQYAYVKDCAWCGDAFFTLSAKARFCCRAHTMAAAGKAYHERKRARA